MVEFAFRLWHEEQGEGMVEYALILVLISLLAIVSMSSLTNAADRMYSGTARRVAGAHARANPEGDHLNGSSGGGWSESGAGNSFRMQNNMANNGAGSGKK